MFKRTLLISMTMLALCTLPSLGQNPPVKKAPAAKAAPPQIHLTGVHLTVDDPFKNYSGACPVMVLFNGSITANAKGAVNYTWQNSEGTKYGQYNVTFAGPGTKTVRQLHWKIMKDTSGWASLNPLPPHDYISSTRAFFNVKCTGHLSR